MLCVFFFLFFSFSSTRERKEKKEKEKRKRERKKKIWRNDGRKCQDVRGRKQKNTRRWVWQLRVGGFSNFYSYFQFGLVRLLFFRFFFPFIFFPSRDRVAYHVLYHVVSFFFSAWGVSSVLFYSALLCSVVWFFVLSLLGPHREDIYIVPTPSPASQPASCCNCNCNCLAS